MTETYSGDEASGKTQSGGLAYGRRRSCAEIERDIENTLQQIERCLSAIEEKFDIRRAFGTLQDFLSTPAGKSLAAGIVITIARRRPLLTCAAGVAYLYFRRPSEYEIRSREQPMYEKRRESTKKRGHFGFEQDPLKGLRMKGPSTAVGAGSETTEDGEYRCEDCGHRTYLEKSIIVPACPDCGGRRFVKQPA